MPTFQNGRAIGLGRWVGRHPLFAAALVTVVCVAAADFRPGWAFLAGLGFAGVGVVCRGWRCGVFWLLCAWLAVGNFTWRKGAQNAAELEIPGGPGGRETARVLADGRGNERFWVAPAKLLKGGNAGARVWWEGAGEVPVAGAVVAADGAFEPLPVLRNPGAFDQAAWLRSMGVAAVFRANNGAGRVETGPLAAFGAAIRHGFRNSVTAGLPEASQEAGVIRAVVIGEKPPDSEELIAAFRNSGTLHVFSVSGLHVAMVGSIGWLLLSWAGVSRRRAVLALLPLVFGYAWITGHSPPAVRAAWMCAVFLGAFGFRRRPDLLNALGAVLLVAMLWNGRLLFQPGVQMSYGVVAAIAIGVAWASRAFKWMAVPELHMPREMMGRRQKAWLGLRRKTAQSMSVSLAAGVGSAPLTAFHFGLVTPISVLAGLVLVPLVYLLLAAALLSVVLHAVAPPVSRFVNRGNGWVAWLCVRAAEGFSAVPGGHFQVGRETRPLLLVYDLEYVDGAACFSDGAGSAVLLDCGGGRSFKHTVKPSLRSLGIDPDSVVLSHPDGGHLGGGSTVWEAFPIRQAVLPAELSRSPAFQSWRREGPKAGIRMLQVGSNESLVFSDQAHLETLNVPDPLAVNAVADERVAVFRLHWRGWKILFTSDAGTGTELKLLDSGRDLSADVIVAGMHTGDLTLGDGFLDAVDPQVVIASNARFPIEERRHPQTMGYWKSRGIRVFDQAESGAVSIFVDDSGNLRLEGFLDAAPVVLRPR